MIGGAIKKFSAFDRSLIVPVTGPEHLCAVQIATRQFCRAIDFNESAVFDAVIGVSELAHRLLVRTPRSGVVWLSAIKRKGGYALEARVRLAGAAIEQSRAADSATFLSSKRPLT